MGSFWAAILLCSELQAFWGVGRPGGTRGLLPALHSVTTQLFLAGLGPIWDAQDWLRSTACEANSLPTVLLFWHRLHFSSSPMNMLLEMSLIPGLHVIPPGTSFYGRKCVSYSGPGVCSTECVTQWSWVCAAAALKDSICLVLEESLKFSPASSSLQPPAPFVLLRQRSFVFSFSFYSISVPFLPCP